MQLYVLNVSFAIISSREKSYKKLNYVKFFGLVLVKLFVTVKTATSQAANSKRQLRTGCKCYICLLLTIYKLFIRSFYKT